jgi:hypothetical protein
VIRPTTGTLVSPLVSLKRASADVRLAIRVSVPVRESTRWIRSRTRSRRPRTTTCSYRSSLASLFLPEERERPLLIALLSFSPSPSFLLAHLSPLDPSSLPRLTASSATRRSTRLSEDTDERITKAKLGLGPYLSLPLSHLDFSLCPSPCR